MAQARSGRAGELVYAPEVVAAYGGSTDELVRRRDEQCPMGHMGDAWDVAYAALFLASDEARYIYRHRVGRRRRAERELGLTAAGVRPLFDGAYGGAFR